MLLQLRVDLGEPRHLLGQFHRFQENAVDCSPVLLVVLRLLLGFSGRAGVLRSCLAACTLLHPQHDLALNALSLAPLLADRLQPRDVVFDACLEESDLVQNQLFELLVGALVQRRQIGALVLFVVGDVMGQDRLHAAQTVPELLGNLVGEDLPGSWGRGGLVGALGWALGLVA